MFTMIDLILFNVPLTIHSPITPHTGSLTVVVDICVGVYPIGDIKCCIPVDL